MSILHEILTGLKQLIAWWYTVTPWEMSIRVRAGRWVKQLGPGIHFRLPFIDRIFLQTIRLRYVNLQSQTVMTKDGKTVTASGTYGYAICDILKLYQSLAHAEATIIYLAGSALAKAIRTRSLAECDQEQIEKEVANSVLLEKYGLAGDRFNLLDFAIVRTFRLIKDERHGYMDERLDMDQDLTQRMPRR